MNQRAMIAAAAASLMSLSFVATPAVAQEKEKKEKCFGIAKAGQNDCASRSGSHSCAGQSRVDKDPSEWKYVAKGSCKQLNGLTLDEVRAASKRS